MNNRTKKSLALAVAFFGICINFQSFGQEREIAPGIKIVPGVNPILNPAKIGVTSVFKPGLKADEPEKFFVLSSSFVAGGMVSFPASDLVALRFSNSIADWRSANLQRRFQATLVAMGEYQKVVGQENTYDILGASADAQYIEILAVKPAESVLQALPSVNAKLLSDTADLAKRMAAISAADLMFAETQVASRKYENFPLGSGGFLIAEAGVTLSSSNPRSLLQFALAMRKSKLEGKISINGSFATYKWRAEHSSDAASFAVKRTREVCALAAQSNVQCIDAAYAIEVKSAAAGSNK
ncbi:hypothetical protein BH11PSE5_BH11PSE5_27900 [soil metagenome]